jgi:hypothetical protein
MTFADINKDGTGMGEIWIIFIVEWAVFLVLAWYLEQVISSATGIRKHWLFPFQCAPPLPCFSESYTSCGCIHRSCAQFQRLKSPGRGVSSAGQ